MTRGMTTDVVTTIGSIRRDTNTRSGNPRYQLLTQAGVFCTEPDAQVNHTLSFGWAIAPRPQVRLTFNDAGQVVDAQEVDGRG